MGNGVERGGGGGADGEKRGGLENGVEREREGGGGGGLMERRGEAWEMGERERGGRGG